MKYVKAFGLFWWNFIVGDDWTVAAGVALALALVWVLTTTASTRGGCCRSRSRC